MSLTVFYPGSFDPMTNGHLDILRKVLVIADKVVVGIGINPDKKPIFSFEERKRLIKNIVEQLPESNYKEIKIISFSNLALDTARKYGARVLVRGLRDATDFDYEMKIAGMNNAMESEINTIFIPSNPQNRPITSTLVRQIFLMGGDLSPFVPKVVLEALNNKV